MDNLAIVDDEIDNAVRGKVFDPSGRPMRDVCLKLVQAEGKPTKYFDDSDCTDEAGAFEVDDKVYKAFKEFALANYGEELKLTEAQLDKGREFIARQLRYDLTTAAYGSVKATQVLMLDDPQVSKAIDSLPRARDLAATAMRGRAHAGDSAAFANPLMLYLVTEHDTSYSGSSASGLSGTR